MLEHSPARFDVREVLFALIFAAALLQQAMLTPDAFQGAMTDAQVELADQAAGAEGGKRWAKLDELPLDGGGSLMRLAVARAGEFMQAGGAVLLEAAQPFAHRGDGGQEEPRGGFDAALLSAFHQTEAMVVGVFHFPKQVEIAGGGHRPAILAARAARLLPPPPGGQFFPPPRADAFQSRQGDTM